MDGNKHLHDHIGTGGYHPSLLQENWKARPTVDQSDLLRRMAIRNSYESKSLGGTVGISCIPVPTISAPVPTISAPAPIPASALLPTIEQRAATLQRVRRSGPRPVSPASMLCIEGRPKTSSDQLQVFGGTLRRSSSHSSVAHNRITPTIQTGSSSYVYHTPSGRKIGANKQQRQNYENVRIQPLPQLQSDMKRSSSYSTVAILQLKDEPYIQDKQENLPASFSFQGTGMTLRNGYSKQSRQTPSPKVRNLINHYLLTSSGF